jgi:hypothetical protein
MPRGKQTKGTCTYCGAAIAKGSVTKHLATCAKRQEMIEKAEAKKANSETLYHLRVQDAYVKDFWLDLEMRGSGTLKDLDHYLRAIWLECCGHMSQFSVGGWSGGKIGMTQKIEKVFQPGVELTHIYDFGTSSETLIKAVEAREGKPTTKHAIALMVRNMMPEAQCIECEQPATVLCMECLTEDETWGMLCEKHAKKHPHKDYGDPIPLVNSPRLGMCGYDGPATPPY